MLKLSANVYVCDPTNKYYGRIGTIVGIQFGLVSDIYTVEIKLPFRSVVEDFEEDQLMSYSSNTGFRIFQVGDRIMVTSKDRKHKGNCGVVTKVPDNDVIVYVKLDEEDEITWYFERELVKEQ